MYNSKKYIKDIKKIFMRCLPDKILIKLLFYRTMGYKINLKNPKTFNEKLQWLKLYDRKDEYTNLVDKYKVRETIAKEIGEEYLIPLIGVWDSVDDIDFSSLPNQFVLKCTHDSGGIVICKNKVTFEEEKAKKKLREALKKNYYYEWREWPYKNIKPRIICEKYMYNNSQESLKDYKFMCFNGEVKCILICSDRDNSEGVKIDFYNKKWEKMTLSREKYRNSDKVIDKPINYDKMIEFSKKLSKNKRFIRVDFYEINEKLYFGELTFYPSAGFQGFSPKEYDSILGDWLRI